MVLRSGLFCRELLSVSFPSPPFSHLPRFASMQYAVLVCCVCFRSCLRVTRVAALAVQRVLAAPFRSGLPGSLWKEGRVANREKALTSSCGDKVDATCLGQTRGDATRPGAHSRVSTSTLTSASLFFSLACLIWALFSLSLPCHSFVPRSVL